MRVVLTKAIAAITLFGAFAAHSQVTKLSSTEIEQRNAAAAFASVREVSLSLLVGECSHLMANSSATMDSIARGWFDRNKPEIEATFVWLDRYLSHLKTTNPEAHKQASLELARETGKGVLGSARVFFARKQPDLSSCEKAATTFSIPQLDLKSMALNPGYEQFAEFPATLTRIRAEPDFSVPSHLRLGMDRATQYIDGISNLASLDAAEAAKERGDGVGRIAIFKSMAERGDGKAAQEIGLTYLNGKQVDKNLLQAYRWFYTAWSLSESDGLNALGVMTRDGLFVQSNLPLAGAAFYVAKVAARNREAFDRALRNLDGVETRITQEEKSQIACMSLDSFDEALQAPIRELGRLVQGKSLSNPDRRLGVVVKDLAEVYKTAKCQ